jgi:hypothetical protein
MPGPNNYRHPQYLGRKYKSCRALALRCDSTKLSKFQFVDGVRGNGRTTGIAAMPAALKNRMNQLGVAKWCGKEVISAKSHAS